VVAGRLDTGLIERRGAALTDVPPPGDDVYAAAALAELLEAEPRGPVVDPWDVPGGWRLGEPAWTVRRLQAPGAQPVTVRVRGLAAAAEIQVGDGPAVPASATREGNRLSVTLGGRTRTWTVLHDGGTLWLAADGVAVPLREHERLAGPAQGAAADGAVTAPMPGTVTVVQVADGDRVEAGTPLLVVEAMKMEHVLTAPLAGTVTELSVTAGQSVRLDERLALVIPATTGEGE
jgi:acetyl-CoA/propionyl-CoA carboxylase biotin carboxyl carrier protein